VCEVEVSDDDEVLAVPAGDRAIFNRLWLARSHERVEMLWLCFPLVMPPPADALSNNFWRWAKTKMFQWDPSHQAD
jgi:hypothetical protein